MYLVGEPKKHVVSSVMDKADSPPRHAYKYVYMWVKSILRNKSASFILMEETCHLWEAWLQLHVVAHLFNTA